MKNLPENHFLRFCLLLLRRYLRHNVAIQSAALAFYLLFSIFPFLIFISALLGTLELDAAAILQGLAEFLPRAVVDLAGMYLRHVNTHASLRLLLFGLVFTVYFPMRATNSLMRSVRTAYHLGPPRGAVRHWVKNFLYTALLILAITITLALMTVGERMLRYAVGRFGLPAFAAELWVTLRFPAAALVGGFALVMLYALAQDSRRPWKDLWPGTVAALVGWLFLSWLYAWYVERIAQYSALYGSIGTVIVLLIWLNVSAVTLVMGAEVNGALISLRKDRLEGWDLPPER